MNVDKKSGVVAIVGRPNIGKSTLLNRVIQSRLSIVSRKAQTTRDNVQGILTTDRGQIVFVDTPGIHNAKAGGLNAYMVAEADRALEGVDLVWYLLDPRTALEHEKIVMKRLSDHPVALILNKEDLVRPEQQQKVDDLLQELPKGLKNMVWSGKISARFGTHLDELLDFTWNRMPTGQPLFPDEDMLSDRPMRYLVGERVREQLYRHLGEELPYSCAVAVREFKELEDRVDVKATIFVERDSQKGMVIGKNAQKIKTIGQDARIQIEKMIGRPMYLGLQVEVLKDWTKDRKALKQMGYHV